MTDHPETAPTEWQLGEWEKVLTIHVGTTYVCRQCENIAMVTKGGLGVMQLMCCGRPMEKAETDAAAPQERDS